MWAYASAILSIYQIPVPYSPCLFPANSASSGCDLVSQSDWVNESPIIVGSHAISIGFLSPIYSSLLVST